MQLKAVSIVVSKLAYWLHCFSPHRFVKASLMGGFFMAVRKYREDDHGEFALPKAHHLHC
ncbi:Uncharacterised protein [Vibrio cholerae]|nr:Uncharacterised protein [Vibrio cholerae]